MKTCCFNLIYLCLKESEINNQNNFMFHRRADFSKCLARQYTESKQSINEKNTSAKLCDTVALSIGFPSPKFNISKRQQPSAVGYY